MGPLTGIKIIELAGIGPGPFCGMMLSDMGAEVIRVDRLGSRARGQDVLNRGRKSIAVDLKSDAGREVVLKLCESADAIFEGLVFLILFAHSLIASSQLEGSNLPFRLTKGWSKRWRRRPSHANRVLSDIHS